jgi:hypothetical protein
MATFPAAVKTYTTKVDLVDINYAAHINDLQDEVIAVQATLGTNPQGGAATVKDRMAAVETGKANTSHTHDAGAITTGSFGVARGGTGRTTLAAGSYLIGDGTNAVALQTPAQVLAAIGAASGAHVHDAEYAPLEVREQFKVFSREGELKVLQGKSRLMFPWAIVILGVRAVVGTAPTGASLLVDVNRDGTTVFTTQSARPTITTGTNTSTTTVPAVTAVSTTQYLTVDIDQVGSTVPGSDLSVFLTYRRA